MHRSNKGMTISLLDAVVLRMTLCLTVPDVPADKELD